MLMNNRVGQKGGGIVPIYNKEYLVKITKKWHQVIISILNLVCECKEQALNYNETLSSTILPMNPTNNIFIDKITKLLTEMLSSNKNYIILGDFNLHVSDQDDVDAQRFSDSMEALGLKQHLTIPTHKSNNVLDLILTEIISDISVEPVETAR